MDVSWASQILDNIVEQYATAFPAEHLDKDAANLFRDLVRKHRKDYLPADLITFSETVYGHLTSHTQLTAGWRQLYTDACLFISLSDVTSLAGPDEAVVLASIARLDRAIIVAGAADENRLELTIGVIARLQFQFLPQRRFETPSVPVVPSSSCPVLLEASSREIPSLDEAPSLLAFQKNFSAQPFILRGHILDWPAFIEHPWSSKDYLRYVAGPGRIVPVEIGKDYRTDDWNQTLMSWDDFLDTLDGHPAAADTFYLAQHNLLTQFPQLRADIVLPDYIYAPPSHLPDYKPPGTSEGILINAWLGPKGTMSPAHTDPYLNFYAQVVGCKTVWLAPPALTRSMYPYPSKSLADDRTRHATSHKEISPSMSNTSQVDVFLSDVSNHASRQTHPDFWRNVVPHAMSATLNPGDILFFPAGWWHAMRSEETSFSVSTWF